MFSVEKIDNGFLLTDHEQGKTDFYKNEKKLINGIRDSLGLKKVGRPKKVEFEGVPQ